MKRFELTFEAEDTKVLKDLLEWASSEGCNFEVDDMTVGMVMDVEAILLIRRTA